MKNMNGFLYILSHPSNPNLLKIGVNRRDPNIRLNEHNKHLDKAAGKVVKQTGKLWELKEVIEVADIYLAEHKFWKRPPLTELHYSFANELLVLFDGTELNQNWVKAGIEVAKIAGVRENPNLPLMPGPIPKRGSK